MSKRDKLVENFILKWIPFKRKEIQKELDSIIDSILTEAKAKSTVEPEVIILLDLKENDYVRTLTKPYTYARVINPKYEVAPIGTWVECKQMLRDDVYNNRWYKSDGTFHELSKNLLKVGEAKL